MRFILKMAWRDSRRSRQRLLLFMSAIVLGIAALVAFDLAAILIVAGLAALAAWQLSRRSWKLDLIARVEARVHAAPTSAPGPERWADVSAARDEYRRVTATGRWLEDRSALVPIVEARDLSPACPRPSQASPTKAETWGPRARPC